MTSSSRTVFSRFNRAQKLAVLVAVIVLLWVLSGIIFPSDTSQSTVQPASQMQDYHITVQPSHAVEKQRIAAIYGVTQALRDVSIAAQTRGQVVEIMAKEGEPIQHGAPIVRLDMQDRQTQLNAARAVLKQRQEEFKGAQLLLKKGFENNVSFSRSEAALKSAQAELEQLKLDIGFTTIRAPFDGILDKINVEVGDFAGVGVFGVEGAIARIIDIDPLLAVGEISQSDRPFIEEKASARVVFGDGTEKTGTLRYISKASSAQSLSFPFEVALPNEDMSLSAGLSVTIYMPLNNVQAHHIPSSLLTLDDSGALQIKTLDDANIVQSYNVTIIEEDDAGLWINGLPESVTIITAGQSLVQTGQQIDESVINTEKPANTQSNS